MKKDVVFSGGGGNEHNPVEYPNTIRSNSVAKVIHLVSSGEISGLVDGLKSVYLNRVPIQNSDGSYNFNGVVVEQRKGVASQSSLRGFSDVEIENILGLEVLRNISQSFSIADDEVDVVRVKLRTPSLTFRRDNGDIIGTSVNLQIMIQGNSDSEFSLAKDVVLSGKTTSPYEESHRIKLEGDFPYVIKVVRVSADSNSLTLNNRTFLQSYTEIKEQALSYDGYAVYGITIDAAQFGGKLPNVSFDLKGKVIKVPVNYNAQTRSYSGVWDGTFKMAYSNNPAWIFYNMLTDEFNGLGKYIDSDFIDKWQLYIIGVFCDEQVSDGFGGMEPRFTFNTQITSNTKAYDAIRNFASVMRAIVFWSHNSVGFSADRVSNDDLDNAVIVSEANVIDGIFNYENSSLLSRPNVVIVGYNDPSDNFRQSVEIFCDDEDVAKRGEIVKEVTAFACSSRGQAKRMAQYIYLTEKFENELLNYSCSLDHLSVSPGSIISVADRYVAGVKLGGRLVSLDEDGLGCVVDSEVDSSVEDVEINLSLNDGTVFSSILSNIDGSRLTFSDSVDVTKVSAKAMYTLIGSNIKPRFFRVISVKEREKNIFDVNAVAYEMDKDALLDNVGDLASSDYSLKPGEVLPPVNFSVQENIYKNNNAILTRITLSWSIPDDVRVVSYKLEALKPNVQSSVTLYEGSDVSFTIANAENGTWSFSLHSISIDGKVSGVRRLDDVLIRGRFAPPDDVTGFSAVRSPDGVTLSWHAVDDLDFVGYEIRRGASFSESVIVVDDLVATSFFVALSSADDISFFIRAKDSSGIFSANVASLVTSVSTPANVDGFVASSQEEFVDFSWNEVVGANQYEIRSGLAWGNSTSLGFYSGNKARVLFPIPGDVIFFIKAYNNAGLESDVAAFYAISLLAVNNRNIVLVEDLLDVRDRHLVNMEEFDNDGKFSPAILSCTSDSEVCIAMFHINLSYLINARNFLDILVRRLSGKNIKWNDLVNWNVGKSWSFFESINNEESVILEISTIQSSSSGLSSDFSNYLSVGFSEFVGFSNGDYNYHEAIIKVSINNKSLDNPLRIFKSTVNIDVEDLVETGESDLSATTVQIDFNRSFHVAPTVVATVIAGVGERGIVEIVETTSTFFRVRVVDTNGVIVASKVSWNARGF